jgi:hypothetical protein
VTDKLEDGIIEIHGKQYQTVARRLTDFRVEHPDWGIETDLLESADYVRMKATIKNEEGRVIATGYAEENRAVGSINKTSAVENSETSCVGRALAFLGKGGTHIRSADEMQAAVDEQSAMKSIEHLIAHNNAVRDFLPSIMAIKEYLARDQFEEAYEAFAELDPETTGALWVAPSKGGIFTTSERKLMKSNEWNDARKLHHNIGDE